jgi:hypothetical protein
LKTKEIDEEIIKRRSIMKKLNILTLLAIIVISLSFNDTMTRTNRGDGGSRSGNRSTGRNNVNNRNYGRRGVGVGAEVVTGAAIANRNNNNSYNVA